MSLVLCGHICGCSCHGPILRRHPGPELEKKYLIEVPAAMHSGECCDGLCPECHAEYIKTGMTKAHLMDCHGKTEAEAEEIMKPGTDIWGSLAATFK